MNTCIKYVARDQGITEVLPSVKNGIGRLSMQNPHKGGYTAATADAKMVAQKLHDKSSESMSADFRVSPGPNDTSWKN